MALGDNLVAYWKFDESEGDAYDSVSGLVLSNVGAAPYVGGIINNGVQTNAVDQYLRVATNYEAPNFLNTSYSLNIWLNVADIASGFFIGAYYAPDNPRDYLIYGQVGEEGYITFVNAAADHTVGWTSGVSDTWYMLTVTYDTTTGEAHFYINGEDLPDSPQTFPTGAPFTNDAHFAVGGEDGASGFNGIMDELGAWARVLSAGEVTELYNDGVGLTYGDIATPTVAVIHTLAATEIRGSRATLNAELVDVGVALADARGYVWGETTHSAPGNVPPSSAGYDHFFSESGSFDTGTYNHIVHGLSGFTTYYFRPYAHNSDGYSYGSERSFTTGSPYRGGWENMRGIVFQSDDTTTIYAEQLNDILARLDALESA